jgi:hypothetical protein
VGKFDNLNDSQVPDLLRRIERLERASPVNNTAIGRDGIEVYDGGVITITNGGLSVTGTANIIGTLIASGIIDFTGDVTISGPLDVEGLMTLVGDLVVASGGKITAGNIELNPDGSAKFGTMTISPAGKITSGSAEINPDGSVKFGVLTIDTNGKVTAGGVSLDPSYLSGSLRFSNGTYVAATPNGAQMVKSGGGAVTVSSGQADLGVPGGGAVIADGSGVAVTGIPTTSSPANVYIDPGSGRLYRVV